MKGTDHFTQTIASYLDKREETDHLYAARRRAVNRSIEDIVTYILNQVKASGRNGFNDDEIYGLAIHASEEENIEIGNPIAGGSVIVNHHIELTEEEKAEQRRIALQLYQDAELRKMEQRNQRKVVATPKHTEQPSLFDF